MNTQQHLWKRATDQEGSDLVTFCGQQQNPANPEHVAQPDAGQRPICYVCYMERVHYMRDRERAADRREGVKTTWFNVDLRFRDRLTGKVRSAKNQHVEIVMPAPNQVLFQDEESGTHRLVALEHIEAIRLAGNVMWDPATGKLT